MKAFITGAGTNIGKSFVTAGLARQLRAEGRAVRAVKPVLSGYDAASALDSDAGCLLHACGLPIDEAHVHAIAPWRYAAPMSPDWAAEDEAKAIPYRDVLRFCREQAAAEGSVLIEGIGGVMVPLTATHTVLDLIADVGLPAVLVVGSYLGALSHALTAHLALKQRGVPCLVVVSESGRDSTMELARTAMTIERHCATRVLTLRRAAGGCHDAEEFLHIVAAFERLTSREAPR